MSSKKLVIASILILAFILLLSTITYARSFTEVLSGGLIQINNFFEAEQYLPYAKAIDFFFFSLLFIAIYMMGARYAFKEVKRPEQVIVILLGLMTAFLLVLADISAVILLPYIHWLFYVLLFMLYWWLLKGIQNKFWRFVLALLLTLLTIALLQGLYSYITAPEIRGIRAPEAPGAPSLGFIGDFFKSLGDSFKGISMPGVSAPGVPDYLKDLWGAPSVAPPTGPTTLPTVPTPPTTPSPPTQPTLWYKTWNWLWLLLLLPLIWYLARRRGERAPTPQPEPTPTPTPVTNIQEIINKIKEVLTKKNESKGRIERLKNEKNNLIQQGDVKTGFIAKLKSLADEDIANLFVDESRTLEDLEEGNIKEFIKKEREFLQELKKLAKVEKDEIYENINKNDNFGPWGDIIIQNVPDDKKKSAKNLLFLIKTLIDQNINQRAEDKQKGILWLIAYCYNLEAKQNILAKELANLFEEQHIKDLVKGRFKEAIKDEVTLEAYNQKENDIIALLLKRITEQIRILGLLKDLITPTAAESTEIEELKVKYNNAAGNEIMLTKEQAAEPANIISIQTEITVFTKLAKGPKGKFKVACYIDRLPVKDTTGKIVSKEVEKTDNNISPVIKWKSTEFDRSLLSGDHQIAFYILSLARTDEFYGRKLKDLKVIKIHIGPTPAPETKGTFVSITKPRNDPEGRKPFYLNENIEFKAVIRNLEIPKEGYTYVWFELSPEKQTIERILSKSVTHSYEVIDTFPANRLGVGKHILMFALVNVFLEVPLKRRDLYSYPIVIHIKPPKGRKELKGIPERKLLKGEKATVELKTDRAEFYLDERINFIVQINNLDVSGANYFGTLFEVDNKLQIKTDGYSTPPFSVTQNSFLFDAGAAEIGEGEHILVFGVSTPKGPSIKSPSVRIVIKKREFSIRLEAYPEATNSPPGAKAEDIFFRYEIKGGVPPFSMDVFDNGKLTHPFYGVKTTFNIELKPGEHKIAARVEGRNFEFTSDSIKVYVIKEEPPTPITITPQPNPNDILREFEAFAIWVGNEINKRRGKGKRIFNE